MKVLYIGDIMAAPGIEAVRRVLPEVKRERQVDFVIAQGENVSDGKSMTPDDMRILQEIGVDFFTGGNHTPRREELRPLLEADDQPVIAPANLAGAPGKGWKVVQTALGNILIISILGDTVGGKIETANPLRCIDEILELNESVQRVATVVNIHGDYSSEKVVLGYYLDGKVSAVIGDHWHVPTADAMVLPKGTAHITDVGMCGVLHSSLGVKAETIISRWRDNAVNKNELETEGPLQFSAVLVTVKDDGLAEAIEQIYLTSI